MFGSEHAMLVSPRAFSEPAIAVFRLWRAADRVKAAERPPGRVPWR